MPSTGTSGTKCRSRSLRRTLDECAGRPLPRREYQPRERDSWHIPPSDQAWLYGRDDDDADDPTASLESPSVEYSDDRRTVPLRLVGSASNPLAGATRRGFRAGCGSMRAVLLNLRDEFPHDPDFGKRKPRSAAAKHAEHINSRLARKVYRLLDDESMNAAADGKPIPLGYNPNSGTEFISGSNDRESPVSHVFRTYRELNNNDRLLRLARSGVRLWAGELDHGVLPASATNDEAERFFLAGHARAVRLRKALLSTKHVRAGFIAVEVSPCWHKGQRAVSVHFHLILEPAGDANLEVTVSVLWSMTRGKEFSGTVHTSPTLRGGPADYDSVLNIFQYAAGTTSIHGLRLSKFMLGFFRPFHFASTPWAEARAARQRENGYWCKDTFRLFLVHTETAGQKRRFFGAWDGRSAEGKAAKSHQNRQQAAKSCAVPSKRGTARSVRDLRSSISLLIPTRENAKRPQAPLNIPMRPRNSLPVSARSNPDAESKPKPQNRASSRQIAGCSSRRLLVRRGSSARLPRRSASRGYQACRIST